MRKFFLIQAFKYIIIISIAFNAIQLLVRIYNIIILNLVINGNESYRDKLYFIVQEIKIENIAGYIIVISFIVLLSIWFYLKYKKAHLESSLNLWYKPIWALFSFIIPIFNLIAPYRIMNDLWTVYNKDMAVESYGKNQIKIWWFLSIALFVLNRYLGIKAGQVSDLQDYLSLEYISLVIFAISIHYYLLLNKLVKMIGN